MDISGTEQLLGHFTCRFSFQGATLQDWQGTQVEVCELLSSEMFDLRSRESCRDTAALAAGWKGSVWLSVEIFHIKHVQLTLTYSFKISGDTKNERMSKKHVGAANRGFQRVRASNYSNVISDHKDHEGEIWESVAGSLDSKIPRSKTKSWTYQGNQSEKRQGLTNKIRSFFDQCAEGTSSPHARLDGFTDAAMHSELCRKRLRLWRLFLWQTIQPGMYFVFSLVHYGTARQAIGNTLVEVDMKHEWQFLHWPQPPKLLWRSFTTWVLQSASTKPPDHSEKKGALWAATWNLLPLWAFWNTEA